jgi:hypothetical protein
MAKMLAGLVLLGSTATGLAAARLPTQWPGARYALVFAFAPTDGGAATRRADPEAPSRQPNRRKAVLHHQLQNQIRISPIMFLLSWLGHPYTRWVTNLAFDSQLVRQVQKPLHRSTCFNPYSHWAWKLAIKLPHIVTFVRQSQVHNLSGCGVQYR